MSGERWYGKTVRVLQFNIEDEDGAYVPWIEGRSVVGLAEEIHANVIVIFARDAWGRAFYDSEIAPKHAKLGGRDFLKEVLESARDRGIRVVVMVAHTTNPYLYSRNPRWAQINVHGKLITMDTDPKRVRRKRPHWPLMCLNGPFLEYSEKEVEEVLERGVDGVFLDSFRYQPDYEYSCYCDNCSRIFREENGYDIPRAEDWDWEFYRRTFLWRYTVNVRAIRRLKERVMRVRPNVPLIYNSHPGGWGGRFNMVVELARDYIDVVYAECSEADFQPPGFIAEMVRLTKAMNGGKPVWASRNSFHTVLTTASTTPVAVRQGLREAVIAGGSPLALVFSSAFVQDRRSLKAVADVYRELELLEEYLEDLEPIGYAAIVFSNSTVSFFGRRSPELVIDEVRGFYYSLLWSHVPVTYISDSYLKQGDLKRFNVIVLPNTACMSREAVKRIEDYVRDGGGVIATFLTSKMDESGNVLEEFSLSEILGVEYTGLLEFPWSYVRIVEDHALVRGFPRGSLVLWGDFDRDFIDRRVPPMLAWHARVAAREGTRVVARIVAPAAEYGNEYNNGRSPPIAGASLDSPAITVGEDSRTAYFSGQLGRLAWLSGLPDYLNLAANSVVWAGGRPPIWGSPPESYELSAFRQDGRLVIHLLNYTYNQRILAASIVSLSEKPQFGSAKPLHPAREAIPLRDLKVFVDAERLGMGEPVRAYSPLTGTQFRIVKEGGVNAILVPLLKEYELLVVE